MKSPTSMRDYADAYTYRTIKNEIDRNEGKNPSFQKTNWLSGELVLNRGIKIGIGMT